MSHVWRVAVLGLGHWYSAFNLGRALREYPKARLVAASWHNKPQLDQFTHTFGVNGYDDAAALIAREGVDIVHIASPVSEIPEAAIMAARAGKHIILGKPMAMTAADADRMVEAVRSAGVTCVPFQGIMRLRFAALKQRIEKGEIGDIILLHQTSRWSIAEDWLRSGTPGWFADPRCVPGGALIDEGIYWMDLFSWMTGSRIVEADARTRNLVHKDIAVEDWGMATFTTASGVLATLEASWTINSPQKTGPSPKQNAVVRFEVVGSRGEMIEQWFRAPGRAVLAAGARDWVFERDGEDPLSPAAPMPLDHLIGCIEHGTTPVATIDDARTSLIVALAAYESARAGRPIRVSS